MCVCLSLPLSLSVCAYASVCGCRCVCVCALAVAESSTTFDSVSSRCWGRCAPVRNLSLTVLWLSLISTLLRANKCLANNNNKKKAKKQHQQKQQQQQRQQRERQSRPAGPTWQITVIFRCRLLGRPLFMSCRTHIHKLLLCLYIYGMCATGTGAGEAAGELAPFLALRPFLCCC